MAAYMRTEFYIHAKQAEIADGRHRKCLRVKTWHRRLSQDFFFEGGVQSASAAFFFGWRECCEGDGDGEQHAQRGVKAGVKFCKSAIPYRLEKSYIPKIADSSKGKQRRDEPRSEARCAKERRCSNPAHANGEKHAHSRQRAGNGERRHGSGCSSSFPSSVGIAALRPAVSPQAQ